MSTYYNEIDPLKAEVLREAIRGGAIAPGDVDERSISDVRGGDLRGYSQCHFFAGGGFWSLAFRIAGVPDDWPWWSGSCPCPSFSAAGKGGGFDDPRHLWPDWARLIGECKPAVVFGEQADDAVGYGWFDLVQTDLEAATYAVGKVVFGAHSVGAPHIRQRLYFCADTEHAERRSESAREQGRSDNAERCGPVVGEDTVDFGRRSRRSSISEREGGDALVEYGSLSGSRDDAQRAGSQGHGGDVRPWRGPGWLDPEQARSVAEAGATRGFWADCDWWYGRDDKYRPIGPGLQPLAHGSPARVGRLRLYGDGIVVPQAAEFVQAYLDLDRRR